MMGRDDSSYIRVVELFAGVGGFRLGLESASPRFKTIWADQWEPIDPEQNAFKCYEYHFGGSGICICADIKDVIDQVPEHDLLVGGFPCQDYSVAKSGAKGIEGEKGSLWWQIEKVIRAHRPKCVVLENVDRILRSPSKQRGRDFAMILRTFYDARYMVEWRVINAADYGYAQRRRRTFIIALRNDTERFKELATVTCISGSKGMREYLLKQSILSEAFPVQDTKGHRIGTFIDEISFGSMDEIFSSMKVDLLGSGLMMNGFVYSEELLPRKQKPIHLFEILEQDVSEKYDLNPLDMDRWTYLKGEKTESRRRADGRSFVFSEGAVPFPDPLDRPARTMLTGEGTVSRSSHVVRDPNRGSLRILTPIECERLNGFPDGWTEMIPERYRYFTMGNALVVPIVKRIGKALSVIL